MPTPTDFLWADTTHALLQWLLALAGVASVALMLILPLRPLLRRLGGPALAYAAWALLPLALLATLLPHPVAAPTPVVVPLAVPMAAPESTRPTTVLVTQPATARLQVDEPLLSDATWLALWLAGAALLLTAMVWQQWRLQRALGTLRPGASRHVRHSTRVDLGPLVLGLLRPRIVLPADFRQRYTAREQALILAHEAAHLRHGDLMVNALAAVLQVLFWFNPLVHLASARLRFDQELACDAAVLRRRPQRRQAYANAILKTQLGSGAGALLPMPITCHWQPRHPLKERIMQLTRPITGRAQRRALQALLLATTLASGYGAWAAVTDLQTVPLWADTPAAIHATEATPTKAAKLVAETPAVPAESADPAPAAAAHPAVAAKALHVAPMAAPAATPAPVGAAAPAAAPMAVAPSAPAASDVTPPYPESPSVRAARWAASVDAPAANGWSMRSDGTVRAHAGRWNEGTGEKWVMAASDPAQVSNMPSVAPDGSPLYRITVDISTIKAGKARTQNMAMAVKAGEGAAFTVNEGGRLCKFKLNVNPRGDNSVALDMPVECNDGQHHPRVVTRLGEPATIEFGKTDGVVQRFTLVVTAPSPAVQPTPKAAATTPFSPDAGAHYKMSYRLTRELPGQAPVSNESAFAIPGDGHTDIRFTGEQALQCDFGFEVRGGADSLVEIKSPLRCGDQATPFTPRLITKLGAPATVEFGGDPAQGGTRYRLVMTVTRWPSDVPWPMGKAGSQAAGAAAPAAKT